ncbi:MAG: phosphatase PAP2 family protein [Actinomycetota bacterium]|nr:phosphatase PAP2 family protein [Actinomycetota bacterium]
MPRIQVSEKLAASLGDTFQERHRGQFNPERLAIARGRTGRLIAAVALTVFGVIFMAVRTNRSAAADAAITMKLQEQTHPRVHRLMQVVSWPGFPPQSRIIPPTLAAAMMLAGFRIEGIFQLLAWGTGGVSFTIKRVMRRSRPGGADFPTIRVIVARLGGSSFPSGHVLNYMGIYGFLSYLVYTWIRPTAIRRAILSVLLSLIALVGPSRIYLGHHWFTDVMASYLLGTTYLIALTGLYRRLKLRLLRQIG